MTTTEATRGAWMETYTGRKFYLLSPDPDDVSPDDIAHALGLLCRYGGHVSQFYSVAEHCWLLSYAVAPEHALHALLHDATEAYVGDMIRPLKRSLPDFGVVEDGVWKAIAARFGVDPAIPDEVRDVDTRILVNERAVLTPNSRHPWPVDGLEPVALPDGLTPRGFAPRRASQLYTRRLNELWTGI